MRFAIANLVLPGATGNSGNIRINTGSLFVTNSAQLNASTSGQGSAGNVIIDARDRVSFDGGNALSNLGENITGKGGDIRINTGTLSVTNNATLATTSSGRGSAGNVIVNARENIFFDGGTATTAVAESGIGDSGDIRLSTGSLFATNNSLLFTSNVGRGSAGNLIINARENVVFSDESTPLTSVGENVIGNSGDIRITTESLVVTGGAQLTTSLFGTGSAGDIIIDARKNVLFDGGNITVNANLVEALNGGQLITTTSGSGRAGKITVAATNQVIVDGADATFDERSRIFGARVVNPEAASGFFVRSVGSGIAGDIEVTSPEIRLDNRGRFIADSESGNGGNIKLNVGDLLLLRRDGQISTNAGTAQKGGDGGNININSQFIIAFSEENSDITANAYTGTGGQVQINSQGIFGIEARSRPTDRSDITASSELGIAGVTNINSPDTSSLRNSLNQLPENIIDTNALIANSCIARRNNRQSGTFLITGGGGLPERPGDAPLSPYLTGAIRSVPTSENSATPTTSGNSWKIGDPIVEPQGAYQLANGKLVLSRECPQGNP